jgi:hypothetical protein
MPHLAASDCEHATMPLVLWTTLRRLANFMKAPEAGGNTDGVVRGISGDIYLLNQDYVIYTKAENTTADLLCIYL